MTGAAGLTEAEAQRRIAARGRIRPPASSRSYRSILAANVFTVFNLILGAFGVLTLAFGDWRDALFLGVVVANAAIGITQEVRAKRALDHLAVLVAPRARVVRDARDPARSATPSRSCQGPAGRRTRRRVDMDEYQLA